MFGGKLNVEASFQEVVTIRSLTESFKLETKMAIERCLLQRGYEICTKVEQKIFKDILFIMEEFNEICRMVIEIFKKLEKKFIRREKKKNWKPPVLRIEMLSYMPEEMVLMLLMKCCIEATEFIILMTGASRLMNCLKKEKRK
jgi:hypothetical protein